MSDFFARLPKNENAAVDLPADRSREEDPFRFLLDLEGVEGYATSDGEVLVYMLDLSVAAELPEEVHGRVVKPVLTGEVRAQNP